MNKFKLESFPHKISLHATKNTNKIVNYKKF